jgi:hypothetical protein
MEEHRMLSKIDLPLLWKNKLKPALWMSKRLRFSLLINIWREIMLSNLYARQNSPKNFYKRMEIKTKRKKLKKLRKKKSPFQEKEKI